MRRAGFTLVEILVALVVLEVGLLGVVGTLWLAARTLTDAEILERGVTIMEGVYDSLSGERTPTDGARPSPPGQVRWRVQGRDVHLDLVGAAGDTLARVETRLPWGSP